jgi:hypothetical protein
MKNKLIIVAVIVLAAGLYIYYPRARVERLEKKSE